MSVKPDSWIRRMVRDHKMIEPFVDAQARKGVISYGVSSYGYDFRLADEFQIFRGDGPLDPKKVDPASFKKIKGEVCVMPPNSFVLGRSLEYFRIPRNVITTCTGKSTYARCGLVVNVTPFEPEWEGTATLSISNTASSPVRIYANEGIAQLLFHESDEQCETSYGDRKGKYQKQREVTPPKV